MVQAEPADRLVLSYPADLSDWGRRQLDTPWFRAYLRKTLGEVTPGTITEEFLDVGCCGNTLDVPLRVEATDGGRRVDEDTDIRYDIREACGLDGGWLVQSRAGPSNR